MQPGQFAEVNLLWSWRQSYFLHLEPDVHISQLEWQQPSCRPQRAPQEFGWLHIEESIRSAQLFEAEAWVVQLVQHLIYKV